MPRLEKALADWQSLLEKSFIPLVKLHPNNHLENFAGSAALIDFRNRRLLCSALHVFVGNRIAVQLEWDLERFKTETLPLRPAFFFENPDSQPRLFDFTACDVTHRNEIPMLQKLDENGSGEIETEQKRMIFIERSFAKVKESGEYGFAGITMPGLEPHPSGIDIGTGVVRIVTGLKYSGTANGYYEFNLPVEHPGHEFFKGCSGAPIIDSKGYIVAFVCGGDEENSTVRGFPGELAKRLLVEFVK